MSMSIYTKNEFSERLNAVATKLGIPTKGGNRQKALGKMFGVSQEAARKWLKGEGYPKIETLIEISNKANVSIDSLLTGDNFDSNKTAQQELADYDASTIIIPLLQATASMGKGAELNATDTPVAALRLHLDFIQNLNISRPQAKNLRFIHAVGKSMEPTIHNGDIVLVDTHINTIQQNGIYTLRANDSLFIKRASIGISGKITISSDNPNEKTVDVLDGNHPIDIIGKVVCAWHAQNLSNE